jgi:hypothetical protein
MTHDELLAKIEDDFDYDSVNHKFQYAVRAIVELHKPVLKSKNKYICEGCNLFYPCETIQVVEKELA